jgi:hypothetical protein
MEVFAVPKDQTWGATSGRGLCWLSVASHSTTRKSLGCGLKYSESHDGPRHVLDVIEMEMENAQAVTECAGKEALSGPREAFTGTAR